MRNFMVKIADFFRESDKLLIGLCFFAASYGCLAVFSTTHYLETVRPVFVQALCMGAGLVAAAVISSFETETIYKLWPLVAAGGVIPVILTFFIGVAPEGTDDRAWLDLGFTTFQPAELLKICFIVTFSLHIMKVKPNINKLKYLIPLCLHGAFPVLLIHLQGDDGTALVFAVMMLCMLWAGGLSWKYFLAGFIAVLIASPLIYFFIMNDDQRARFMVLFDLEANIQDIGYQQWRGRMALANGGLFGQGFLKGSLTQTGVIPESFNDFIFVSIGEEFGLFGCLAVLILLGAICLRCIRIARITTNEGGKVMCVGVFAMIFAQSAINIGMCTSLLPVIGITLPFFSSGGTSLLCLFFGIGLALNVYMHRNSRTIYLHD